MKPSSYTVQRACQNCLHRFEDYDFDTGKTTYCTVDGKPRPKCGSVLLGEEFQYPPYDAPDEMWRAVPDIEAWKAWADARIVAECGICDQHTLTKEGGDAMTTL